MDVIWLSKEKISLQNTHVMNLAYAKKKSKNVFNVNTAKQDEERRWRKKESHMQHSKINPKWIEAEARAFRDGGFYVLTKII